MLGNSAREALKHISLRGRVGIALTCIERAIAQHGVRDDRIAELVDALWMFVEEPDQVAADEAWRETRAADDLLEAVDKVLPLPESYRHLPPFLARVLYNTLWSVTIYAEQPLSDGGEESRALIARVLDLCAQHGVAIPPLDPFAQLSIDEKEGWGRAAPRSFFREALSQGTAQ